MQLRRVDLFFLLAVMSCSDSPTTNGFYAGAGSPSPSAAGGSGAAGASGTSAMPGVAGTTGGAAGGSLVGSAGATAMPAAGSAAAGAVGTAAGSGGASGGSMPAIGGMGGAAGSGMGMDMSVDMGMAGMMSEGLTCADDKVPVNGKCVERKVPDMLGSGWVKFDPGPPTTCVFNDPFSFYVRKGTVNKVMLYMQGGGACWDEATCALPIYGTVAAAPGSDGILDPNNPDNPFKDWYVVYTPYCSADVALGNSTKDYGAGPLQHKGFVNMQAAQNWVYENMTAPEFIFVTGCSAGAVGATLHAAYMVKAYSDNPMVDGAVITDSYQAIITEDFAGLTNWGVRTNFPDWLPELKALEQPYPADIMARGFKEALNLPFFSRMVAGHFNFAEDGIQSLFYGFMGGDAAEVPMLIKDAVHDISAAAPDNYRYFIAPGANHCVFESDAVYSLQAGGQSLIEWLGKVSMNQDVKSVE